MTESTPLSATSIGVASSLFGENINSTKTVTKTVHVDSNDRKNGLNYTTSISGGPDLGLDHFYKTPTVTRSGSSPSPATIATTSPLVHAVISSPRTTIFAYAGERIPPSFGLKLAGQLVDAGRREVNEKEKETGVAEESQQNTNFQSAVVEADAGVVDGGGVAVEGKIVGGAATIIATSTSTEIPAQIIPETTATVATATIATQATTASTKINSNKRNSVFSVASTTAFVDYLADLFKAIPTASTASSLPQNYDAHLPGKRRQEKQHQQQEALEHQHEQELNISSTSSIQNPRISLTQFRPYSPYHNFNFSRNIQQPAKNPNNSTLSSSAVESTTPKTFSLRNRDSERSGLFLQSSSIRKFRPYPLLRSTSSSSSQYRNRISFQRYNMRLNRYSYANDDPSNFGGEPFRDASVSDLESHVDLDSSIAGTDALENFSDNYEEEEDGGEVEEEEDEEFAGDDLDATENALLHDGWKSFIEWRNGIENLGQANTEEDGLLENSTDQDEIFSTQEVRSESFHESGNFSAFSIKDVVPITQLAETSVENALAQIEGGERTTGRGAKILATTSNITAVKSKLPIVMNEFDELSPTEIPQAFNVSRLQEFLSTIVNPFNQLRVTARKSAPVLDVTRTISSGHFFATRNRSHTTAANNLIPNSATPIWKDVPFMFFKNALYWSVTVFNHDQSADDSVKKLNFGQGSEFTSYQVTLKILQPKIYPFDNDVPCVITIIRRYSQFQTLFEDLLRTNRENVSNWPEFPKRNYFGRFDPETIRKRASAFSALLNFISLHPVMFNSPPVMKFLGSDKNTTAMAEATNVTTESPILARIIQNGASIVFESQKTETSSVSTMSRRSFSNPIH